MSDVISVFIDGVQREVDSIWLNNAILDRRIVEYGGVGDTEVFLTVVSGDEIPAWIDGEPVLLVSRYWDTLESIDGTAGYRVFGSSADAGTEARRYWEDMMAHRPSEFIDIISPRVAVDWLTGVNSGPGSVGFDNVEGWLDYIEEHPEEEFAQYDGVECSFMSSHKDYLDYAVAYRFQ